MSEKGDRKKVHLYQKCLTESRSARLLAVFKVTQDNRGNNTAGVDGVKSILPGSRLALSRAKDLRLNDRADKILRVYIPKPGTSERRPLGNHEGQSEAGLGQTSSGFFGLLATAH